MTKFIIIWQHRTLRDALGDLPIEEQHDTHEEALQYAQHVIEEVRQGPIPFRVFKLQFNEVITPNTTYFENIPL
jgi:hypothetical protein